MNDFVVATISFGCLKLRRQATKDEKGHLGHKRVVTTISIHDALLSCYCKASSELNYPTGSVRHISIPNLLYLQYCRRSGGLLVFCYVTNQSSDHSAYIDIKYISLYWSTQVNKTIAVSRM